MAKLILICIVACGLFKSSMQDIIKKVEVCEHKTAQLSCGSNQAINVISAFYGRLDTTTCAMAGSMSNTNCAQASAFGIVNDACTGKSSCNVNAENAVFQDPCVGTFKYMDIQYSCQDVQTARSCENKDAASLSCGGGGQLRIVSAMYGRQSSSYCPGAQQGNTNCVSSNSKSVVKGLCQYKTSCSVNPTNGVFGDPCVGTYKYLEVKYYCTSERFLSVCENGGALTPSCGAGQVVNIASGIYGRTTKSFCPNNGQSLFNTNCGAPRAIQVARNLCNGKSQCSVNPNNAQFGDPCVNTFKYLVLVYFCTPVMTARVCEHQAVQVSCGGGGTINVVSALYGRRESGYCPGANQSNTNCAAGTSGSVVGGACNGRTSCAVSAENSVFGDPCVGTFKYLQIQYYCA